jgi:hypothetical protein
MVLCDRSGTRMPAVRENMQKKIGEVYKGLDLTLDCFPADDVADDPDAFVKVHAPQLSPCRPPPGPAPKQERASGA